MTKLGFSVVLLFAFFFQSYQFHILFRVCSLQQLQSNQNISLRPYLLLAYFLEEERDKLGGFCSYHSDNHALSVQIIHTLVTDEP